MGRLGRPAELNGLAVFLASDASGFMTGSNVMCDVSPRLVFLHLLPDRMLMKVFT